MFQILKIIDISGKLLKEFNGTFNSGHEFSIQSLSQGLYIVKIGNNTGQQLTTKLIKL